MQSLFSVTVPKESAHLIDEREGHRLDISWHARPDGQVLVMGRHVGLFLDHCGISDFINNRK